MVPCGIDILYCLWQHRVSYSLWLDGVRGSLTQFQVYHVWF
jgi:hypothetical protein